MKLPGLIDVHVHMREPGAAHKEDWETGTAAALAGGITMVLAMPNTQPPTTDDPTFEETLALARQKARCDFGLFIGAGPDNVNASAGLSDRAAGLKMYLDATYGPLRLDDMTLWMDHFTRWPSHRPVAIHAEGRTLAAAILMADLFKRPIHLCHVSRREEILIIKKAKEAGIPVTCEVCPHHLFLTTDDIDRIGPGRSEVRPRLASPADRDALWEHLPVIDIFATDHAPHTLQEKDGAEPPPGFPGLETILPLLLTAVKENRLTTADLIDKMHTNPRRIFGLPEQPETWIEVDPDAGWEIRSSALHTRAAWTPFDGWRVRGRVQRVVLRGKEAFRDGKILSPPGAGRPVR
jgi:carbamoyl-phosphate synthase/aspartate carbamoyltransferase/dihydroorotase